MKKADISIPVIIIAIICLIVLIVLIAIYSGGMKRFTGSVADCKMKGGSCAVSCGIEESELSNTNCPKEQKCCVGISLE